MNKEAPFFSAIFFVVLFHARSVGFSPLTRVCCSGDFVTDYSLKSAMLMYLGYCYLKKLCSTFLVEMFNCYHSDRVALCSCYYTAIHVIAKLNPFFDEFGNNCKISKGYHG